jgi:7-cyano-7-deazaguanine reductase
MSDITRHLGQKSAYKRDYDPSLLVREPRQANRTYLGLQNEDLPFDGFDTWNAYEVSGLTKAGLPVSFVVKIVYPASNEYIVESKSLKLYFNSFAMTRCGQFPGDVGTFIKQRTIADLSGLLGCDVGVGIVQQHRLLGVHLEPVVDMELYETLEQSYWDCVCEEYSENPDLLDYVGEVESPVTLDWHSSSLVSCCKVTGQPDSGDVFITMTGTKHPTPVSLLRYIVSFREEHHFHEEICEAIWKRLHDRFKPDFLSVTCLYSRRGGIDINPCRFTKGADVVSDLARFDTPHCKIPRQ